MAQSVKRLEAGDKAPDFTLPDQAGKKVKLSALRGRTVVLYFYPKDFTGGCTREACEFRDNYSEIRRLDADIIGVSPDKGAEHDVFAAEYSLPFRLLSDENHEVMKRYGAWGLKKQYGREYEGVIRSTFLIGADGKIAYLWRKVNVDGHSEKVIAELKKLAAGKPTAAK